MVAVGPVELVGGVVHDELIDHTCAVDDEHPVRTIQIAALNPWLRH